MHINVEQHANALVAPRLHFAGKRPEGVQLSYGNGKNPYANLRDEAGLGALVFGPLPILPILK